MMNRTAKFLLLFLSGVTIALGLNLLTTSFAFAQAEEAVAVGALAGFVTVIFLISIAFYVFFAICLQTMANKLNIENSWLAWIPLANLWVWVKVAGRPDWWVILFFLPFVNFVVGLIILFDVPPRFNKPPLLGLLVFIPLVGAFLYFGIMAFG